MQHIAQCVAYIVNCQPTLSNNALIVLKLIDKCFQCVLSKIDTKKN
jgi:hypothetical protein